MYNFNNLEDMLRSGVTADEIAQAFTKNLNNAIDAVKPTPLQEAGEELAKAWNHMIDLYLEDNDAPAFVDEDDDLYISGETATHLFEESMSLMHKLTPLWDLIEALANADEDDAPVVNNKKCECTKNAPVKNNTDGIDEFDEVMRKFLNSLK